MEQLDDHPGSFRSLAESWIVNEYKYWKNKNRIPKQRAGEISSKKSEFLQDASKTKWIENEKAD